MALPLGLSVVVVGKLIMPEPGRQWCKPGLHWGGHAPEGRAGVRKNGVPKEKGCHVGPQGGLLRGG